MKTASATTMAAMVRPALAQSSPQRVLVASGADSGIVSYGWNEATGELTPAGVVAHLSTVDWIAFSPSKEYLYAACEVDSFNGKPTGEVASFSVKDGLLIPLSAENAASRGTCHLAVDKTGGVVLAADYGGGSVAAYKVDKGKLGAAVWTDHYTQRGPNHDRQEAAHAHFCSFAPNNRFAYVNDLGGDRIHIYDFNPFTVTFTPAGAYHAAPGSGPRTLHFHPNGKTAYSVNELVSTVDVLHWHSNNGKLSHKATLPLLPPGTPPTTRACDTVITRDGKFVYFANRDKDFLYAFRANPSTGALTPMKRTSCGGKIPRSFTLDPTERWMLVANQDSNVVSVFARNPETGELAEEGRNFAAPKPMCILFA